jgi:hypothetical protein
VLLAPAFPRRKSESDSDRKAASGHEAWGMDLVDEGGAAGVELIGKRDTRDGQSVCHSAESETLNIVRVEQVGWVQTDLGAVEDGAIADGVVDVSVHGAEGRNNRLVAILAIIHAFFGNAVVEDV